MMRQTHAWLAALALCACNPPNTADSAHSSGSDSPYGNFYAPGSWNTPDDPTDSPQQWFDEPLNAGPAPTVALHCGAQRNGVLDRQSAVSAEEEGWVDTTFPQFDERTFPNGVIDYPLHQPLQPAQLNAEWTPWTSGTRIAMAGSGDALYVLDRANGVVAQMGPENGIVTRVVAVGTHPEQMVLGPDGSLYVTVGRCGEVVKVAPGSDTVTSSALLGARPYGIALSKDGTQLVVTLRNEDAVVLLDAATLAVLDRVDGVVDQPTGVAFSHTVGAVVTHRHGDAVVLPVEGNAFGSPMVHQLRDASPVMIRYATTLGAVGLRAANGVGAVVHPESGEATILHAIARTGTVTVDIEGGSPVTRIEPGGYYPVTITGLTTPSELGRPLTPGLTRVGPSGVGYVGASDPVRDAPSQESPIALLAGASHVAHHPTATLLFVTGRQSDTLVAFNSATNDPMSDPVATFRVGHAPTAVTFSPSGNYAYVVNEHDYTVSKVHLANLLKLVQPAIDDGSRLNSAQHVRFARQARFGTDPLPADLREGRRLFTFVRNPAISRFGELSCASCHLDGHEDGISWVVAEGRRQTPALAGRLHGTAPFNWLGSRPTLVTNMHRTIARMGGSGLGPHDSEQVGFFMLEGMPAPQNPHVAGDGQLTPAQTRGKVLFEDATVGCATCHSGEAYTDNKSHNVGTATAPEIEAGELELNTPSLRGLFHTAPYLHDGSAPTLLDVLERTATTMGKTDHLTLDEKLDLIAYLKTL